MELLLIRVAIAVRNRTKSLIPKSTTGGGGSPHHSRTKVYGPADFPEKTFFLSFTNGFRSFPLDFDYFRPNPYLQGYFYFIYLFSLCRVSVVFHYLGVHYELLVLTIFCFL